MTARRQTTKKVTVTQPTDAERKQYGRVVLVSIPYREQVDAPEIHRDEQFAAFLEGSPYKRDDYECTLTAWVDHTHESGSKWKAYKEVWVLK